MPTPDICVRFWRFTGPFPRTRHSTRHSEVQSTFLWCWLPARTRPSRLMPSIAAALRAHGCANVKVEVIKNSVHYVVEEQPDAVVELIERYASL